MARTQRDIASFLSGEVTPALGGRSETDEYAQFVQTLENVFVEKHGGIKRRGGLQFVHPSSNDDKVRLVPFVFSRTESYVMEFGNRIVSLYQNSDYVHNIGQVEIYLGDGSSQNFQYPHDFEVENTAATAGQTVFPYTFDVSGSAGFGVLKNGVELADPADYTHQTGAKTITLVIAAALDDIIQIFHSEVLASDIEVYLDGELQVSPADYDIKPVNTLVNLLNPFGTPAWNGDDTSIGTSWTLPNDGTATSPAGSEPRLTESGIALAHGADIEGQVEITARTLTAHSKSESNTSIVPLVSDGAYISIESIIITDADLGLNSAGATFAAEDASGTGRDSDFFYELRHNDTILSEGTQLAVITPQIISITSVPLPPLTVGDVISLQVRAIGDHAQSQPRVNGTTAPSDVSATGVVNADPYLYGFSTDSAGRIRENKLQLKDLSLPYTWVFTGGFEGANDPQPLSVTFYTDNGAELSMADVYMRNAADGWVVTFTTPPPEGSTVLIRVPEDTAADENAPIFEFASPFTDDEIDQLYWAQANDVMWFCHEDHKPWLLTRVNHFQWNWSQPILYGTPWDLPATSWQADGVAVNYEFYFDALNKAQMEVYFNGVLQTATDWDLKSGQTFPVTDQGAITFTEAPPLGTTVLIAQTVSSYDINLGYPRCVVFFQERLWFAATVGLPQTLWGSRVADFLDFAVKGNKQVLQPDDAVEYTVAAYTHESIEWLSSERVLVIGTSSTEHRLAPDEYIATDRLPRVSKMTDYGGAHQMPMYMGGLTCFVQQSGRQLRSFSQRSDMVLEEYESIELTWMASHMVKDYFIKEPYYALVPNNIAVMIREDGQLLSALYDPSTGQMDAKDSAWSRQITDGAFKSVTVIPTDFGHQIWVATKRLIEGEVKQYVEFFTDNFFMDSAGFSDGLSEITELDGLEHIEKKVVDVLVDGAVHPQRTVIDGKIELAWPGTNVVAGIPYLPKVVTMPYTDGNPSGTGQGKPGRWAEIWVRMIDSAHPLINGRRPPVRHPSTPMGEPEPNFTGAVRVFDSGYSMDKEITITQDLPLQFQLVNIYGTFTIGTG